MKSKIHLCISHEEHPDGRYAALSHCWGSKPILRLTTANIGNLRTEIHVSSLPKSFRDAITVVRRLRVRYLWIDSLCILQDSIEDWRSESVTMDDVYRNAICCIAATAASDGSVGLFRDRNLSLVEISRVPSSWTKQPKQLYELMDGHFWELNIDRAPLIGRAWVVQERVLAPRVIHFGENQLLWECGELNAAESYPNGVPSIFTFPGTRKNELYGTKPAAYYAWKRLVYYYSRCALTKPEDKLIAISGVAKFFQQRTGDRYLAGLWERSLPTHLLWFVYAARLIPSVSTPTIPEQQKPTMSPSSLPHQPYRAPSWSWAALEATIIMSFMYHDVQYMITVLETHITALGADPYG